MSQHVPTCHNLSQPVPIKPLLGVPRTSLWCHWVASFSKLYWNGFCQRIGTCRALNCLFGAIPSMISSREWEAETARCCGSVLVQNQPKKSKQIQTNPKKSKQIQRNPNNVHSWLNWNGCWLLVLLVTLPHLPGWSVSSGFQMTDPRYIDLCLKTDGRKRHTMLLCPV